uniref:Uncharacterized protein n=1 Tax=Leptospirillum ferrodiazotrophum TaxID=412449 RepID=C6HYL4_9BACT|nr:MAG: hypothetical protein UBAL3_94240090 [Leptospirillum ferrodiazotrophum]
MMQIKSENLESFETRGGTGGGGGGQERQGALWAKILRGPPEGPGGGRGGRPLKAPVFETVQKSFKLTAGRGVDPTATPGSGSRGPGSLFAGDRPEPSGPPPQT